MFYDAFCRRRRRLLPYVDVWKRCTSCTVSGICLQSVCLSVCLSERQGRCVMLRISLFNIFKPPLAMANLRFNAFEMSVCPSVRPSACLSPKCIHNNAIFSKTKQLTAMMSIDDL